jgi:hypothetical protein
MNKRTKSEQREIAQNGGIKSGKVRAAFKTITSALEGKADKEKIADDMIKLAHASRSEKIKFAALSFITERLDGKPKQQIEVTSSESQELMRKYLEGTKCGLNQQ